MRDLLAVALVGVLEQDGELVAAEPRGEVVRAHAAADALGRGHQHGVAGGVPGMVVDPLEVVEVEEQHGADPAGPGERLVHAAHEQRAVGEVGERVAVGLALERALQLAHAPDRLLQPVELERHAGVAGERLEQPQLGRAERPRGAEAVAEQHHADQPRLAGDRGDHQLAQAVLVHVGRERDGRLRAADHGGVLVAAGDARSASASIVRDGLHRLRRAGGVERRAQRHVAGRAEQDDLGAADAERLARALEQVDERALDVRARG